MTFQHDVSGKATVNTLQRSTLLLPSLLATILLIAACSTPPTMPVAAVDALYEYWESLPGYQGESLDILRAWQGELPAEALPDWPASMEIWCVEAQPASNFDPVEESEPTIWIVTKENQDAEWTPAFLMAMSSTWPYQACGTVP